MAISRHIEVLLALSKNVYQLVGILSSLCLYPTLIFHRIIFQMEKPQVDRIKAFASSALW